MKHFRETQTIIRVMAAFWLAFLLAGVYDLSHAATPGALIIPSTPQSSQSSMVAPVPSYTDAVVLTANAAQTQAIPAGSNFVVFSANCDFFAKTGASASIPGATTTDGSAAQLNPAAWWLYGSPTQITVISSASCIVTMSFYK